MELPVEQTRTLVALHNMHEEELRSTLKLGAWPSPSIAIVQAAQGHADYGAYSAVFPRSTIDPEADPRNKVYGSDAWTPTHTNAPVEYEVNYDVKRRFDDMVAELTRDFAGGALYHTSPLGGIVHEETTDSIDKIAEKLSKQESVQAAYLAQLGEAVDPVYHEKKYDNLGNDLLRQYIDSVGAQELAKLVVDLETTRKVPDEALEAVRGIIVDDWAERNKQRLSQKPELIDKYKKVQHDRIDEYRVERFIRNAWDYYEDGGATAGEIDRYDTAVNVTNRLSELSPEGDFTSVERMVQEWVRGEIEGLLGESGIYSGADLYDSRGNRKSFSKTHWPVTVENIVKAMNNADARGSGMFGYAASGLVATATPEYQSVADIHADESRLRTVPEDEYRRIIDELDEELAKVTSDIIRTTGNGGNGFTERENIGYTISQAATGKRTTPAIKKAFAKEGYTITTEQAEAVKSLLDGIAKVPTGYFEAKPRRVVEFDEAVAVLAPSNAPADLISEMEDKGMNVLTYEAGNDRQRLELLNSLEGIRFSRELSMEKLREENTLLRESLAEYKRTANTMTKRAEHWKNQTKLTKEQTYRKGDIDKAVRSILEDADATVKVSDVSSDVAELGKMILRGDDMDTIKSKARDIAGVIVESASALPDEYLDSAETYEEIASELRGSTVYISREASRDIPDYNQWRKQHFGRLTLKIADTDTGVNGADSVYERLSNAYPNIFPQGAVAESDAVLRIAEYLDKGRPAQYYENPHKRNMTAATEYYANELIETLLSDKVRETSPTFADKQSAKWKRKRIITHANELSQKLLRPTNAKHIPEELRTAVATVLEAINTGSAYDYDPDTMRFTSRNALIGDRVEKGTGIATKRTEAFEKLRAQYAEILEHGGDVVVDPALDGMLSEVVKLGDTPLNKLNVRQLDTVWKTLRVVEHSITQAGKVLSDAKFARTKEWADRFRADASRRKQKNPLTKSHISIDLEDPYTFFSHFGEAGKAVYRMLRNAQDDARVKLDEIVSDVQDIVDKKTVKRLQEERHTFETAGGDTVTMTTAQLMGIYNLSKRQQAQNHLLEGGIMQPEIERNGTQKRIDRGTKPVFLTPGDIASFADALTDEQKKIADSLQELMTSKLSDWGNSASMKAYGYRKFTGNDYWPIHSATEMTKSTPENSQQNARSIANIGLAKTTLPKANNPVDVYDAFDDFAEHAADMIDYATLLLPMEDANRLYNFKYRNSEGSAVDSLKGLLDYAGGKGSQQYWHKLMADIQNGIGGAGDQIENLANKIVGNTKAASVGANVRVIVQQPTAILRAGLILNPVNMARGIKGATRGSGWKKAMQYAPIARIKDAGSFDQGNLKSLSAELYGKETLLEKLNEFSAIGASKADAVTWGAIWNACEWQTVQTNKDLSPGSEAFYEKTAELFTEVIDQTQVVDGILQRSQAMRSASGLSKQMTSFMGEPTKSLNMLIRSWDQFFYETNPEQRKAAKKTLLRASVALAVTDVVNAAVQSVVDAWRDDDEEKEYGEKWLAAFLGITGDEESRAEQIKNVILNSNIMDNVNPIGRIPWLKDVWSLIQGFTVERMDVSAVSDLIDAGAVFVKNIDGDGKYTRAYAIKQLLTALSKVAGISYANVARDVWGIARTIAADTNNIEVQYQMEQAIYNLSSEDNKSRFMDILYRALEQGEEDLYKQMLTELIDDEDNDIDGASIESAMKSRYNKAKKKNAAYSLPAGMAELIRMIPSYDGEEEETFSVENLSSSAYKQYSEKRAADYTNMTASLDRNSYFASLDEEAQSKVYSYADKLAHQTALAKASGGQYEIETKWIKNASDAAEAGITMQDYVLFHTAYTLAKTEYDPITGKAIKGKEKQDKILAWMEDQEFTRAQKACLYATVYSDKTNPYK